MDARTIVDEALTLLREEGLAGVTVRRLTTALGVTAPTVYWRFTDKRGLLDAVAEAVLHEQLGDLEPAPVGADGHAWLTEVLQRLRRAMLAYPDGARLVVGARPTGTPTLARVPEYGLRALEGSGADLSEAATVVYTALHYTFGHVIEEQDSVGAAPDEDLARDYPTVTRVLLEARRAHVTAEDAFAAGLARIVGAG